MFDDICTKYASLQIPERATGYFNRSATMRDSLWPDTTVQDTTPRHDPLPIQQTTENPQLQSSHIIEAVHIQWAHTLGSPKRHLKLHLVPIHQRAVVGEQCIAVSLGVL
jgi:hypothetical protein